MSVLKEIQEYYFVCRIIEITQFIFHSSYIHTHSTSTLWKPVASVTQFLCTCFESH